MINITKHDLVHDRDVRETMAAPPPPPPPPPRTRRTLQNLPKELQRAIFRRLFDPARNTTADGYSFDTNIFLVNRQLSFETNAALANELDIVVVQLQLLNVEQWLRRFPIAFLSTNAHAVQSFFASGRCRLALRMGPPAGQLWSTNVIFHGMILKKDWETFSDALSWYLFRETDFLTRWMVYQYPDGELLVGQPLGGTHTLATAVYWGGMLLSPMSEERERPLLEPLRRLILPCMSVLITAGRLPRTPLTNLHQIMGPVVVKVTSAAWHTRDMMERAYGKMLELHRLDDVDGMESVFLTVKEAWDQGFLVNFLAAYDGSTNGPAQREVLRHIAFPIACSYAILIDMASLLQQGYLGLNREDDAWAFPDTILSLQDKLEAIPGIENMDIMYTFWPNMSVHPEIMRWISLTNVAFAPLKKDSEEPAKYVTRLREAVYGHAVLMDLMPDRVGVARELLGLRSIRKDLQTLDLWSWGELPSINVITRYQLGSTTDVPYTKTAHEAAAPTGLVGWG